MTHLIGLAQTAKTTLDDTEVFVVDLSSELVEKDLQIEQVGNHTRELEQQVEIRDNTIEVLENHVHDVQEELDDANAHLDMNHQDMNQALEADWNNEDRIPR
jgi:peptidoglycan hydrolase CwlO-like protein